MTTEKKVSSLQSWGACLMQKATILGADFGIEPLQRGKRGGMECAWGRVELGGAFAIVWRCEVITLGVTSWGLVRMQADERI